MLAFAAGEIICRIADIGNPGTTRPVEPRQRGGPYRPGSQLVYSYPSNPRGYFDRNNSVTGRINSHGFRGREAASPKTGIRIAFLGDSFTLGVGVRDEHTLPVQFETELRKFRPDAEALNFGVSGTHTGHQVEILKRYVLGHAPDIVVGVLFLNDAGALGTVEFLGRGQYLRGVRSYSRLVDAVVRTLEAGVLARRMKRIYTESFADSSAGYQRLQKALTEAQSLANAHGFRFVLAVYPVLYRLDADHPFTGIHAKLEKLSARLGIDFIDLLPAFLGGRDRDLWVHAVDQHPNEVAHGLAAKLLAARLAGYRELVH
jgi:lysophospholipase L1-like esterase